MGLLLDMFWWGFAVFCKPFGLKHIGQVSVNFSVNVDGNGSRAVDLDHVPVQKNTVSMKHPFINLWIGCFCEGISVKAKPREVDVSWAAWRLLSLAVGAQTCSSCVCPTLPCHTDPQSGWGQCCGRGQDQSHDDPVLPLLWAPQVSVGEIKSGPGRTWKNHMFISCFNKGHTLLPSSSFTLKNLQWPEDTLGSCSIITSQPCSQA